MCKTACLAVPHRALPHIPPSLVELFYARQDQANVSVANVKELCAMIKLCAVSTLSSALNMGARPDELDESGVHVMCLFYCDQRHRISICLRYGPLPLCGYMSRRARLFKNAATASLSRQ
jgi:hypothetical protein